MRKRLVERHPDKLRQQRPDLEGDELKEEEEKRNREVADLLVSYQVIMAYYELEGRMPEGHADQLWVRVWVHRARETVQDMWRVVGAYSSRPAACTDTELVEWTEEKIFF